MLGEMIEPWVSLPIAKGTRPAATAAPGPALEPPEPSEGIHGFLVLPLNQVSFWASAPRLSFATRIAPACRNLSTTAESKSNICDTKGAAPQVVGMPLVEKRSFKP